MNGSRRSLLIDTGLGIGNIYDEVKRLADNPVTAVATHVQWDHIGGHKYFSDFYAHREGTKWLSGEFSLSVEMIRRMIINHCDLPENYDIDTYTVFQGMPTRILKDGDIIPLIFSRIYWLGRVMGSDS